MIQELTLPRRETPPAEIVPLTPDEIEVKGFLLRTMRESLEKEMALKATEIERIRADYNNANRRTRGVSSGRGSEACILLQQLETENGLLSLKREALAKINCSLRRIQAGIYDNCRVCDESLGILRLNDTPTADKHVACEKAAGNGC